MSDVADKTTATSVRRLATPNPKSAAAVVGLLWLFANVVLNVYLLTHPVLQTHSAGGLRQPGVAGFLWVFASFALTGAGGVAAWFMARAARRASARKRARWPAKPTVQSLASAAPGLISLRGRVRAADGVRPLALDGRDCVAATIERASGPLAPALITYMTDFELESETGERTRVRASQAVVSATDGGDPVVAVGDDVIVRGHAARVPARTTRTADYRSVTSELELSGTTDEPLRVRRVRADEVARVLVRVDASAPTQVRVAANVDASGDTDPKAEPAATARRAPR